MSKGKIRRIAICTGGGDAPGLNAVIRAVVISSLYQGWECIGIRDGFNGILFPERYGGNGTFLLTRECVRGITHLGGTILGTTNKGNPMHFPIQMPDGSVKEVDRCDEIVNYFAMHEVDALVSVGGDGSLAIASALAQKGLRVVSVPKTIDNDLDKTIATFGFDTAVTFATECIDRLHATAESHQRIMVVEVMGRYAGWIALNAGLSGTAHVILIPEIPYDLGKVAEKIQERDNLSRNYSIVVVAEGAKPKDGTTIVATKAEGGHAERLGGIGDVVARQLQVLTGKDARSVVLGHLLRGGTPTATDRLLSLRFGAAAVRALAEGASNIMVALDPPTVRYVPIEEVTGRMKLVPPDCDTILTARNLGISFGD
jgi:ATP-dependent phosphofructokinase / diphosphate-dependent phosphofructokinase